MYRASSKASRRSSSSRAVDGVPLAIAQFLPPIPHRLKAIVLPPSNDTALELGLVRTATCRPLEGVVGVPLAWAAAAAAACEALSRLTTVITAS